MPRYEFEGEEAIRKEVSKHGNGAHVYVPKDWLGREVQVVLVSDPDQFQNSDDEAVVEFTQALMELERTGIQHQFGWWGVEEDEHVDSPDDAEGEAHLLYSFWIGDDDEKLKKILSVEDDLQSGGWVFQTWGALDEDDDLRLWCLH